MRFMPLVVGLISTERRLFAALSLAVFALVAGCPNFQGTQPQTNGGGGGGSGTGGNSSGSGAIRAEIVTPSSSFAVSSLDAPVAVRYSVPTDATDVRGFRVPVADKSPNSTAIGETATVAIDLPTGTNKFFDFDPQKAGVGFFRVGILYVIGGEEKTAESSAVIQVQGPPAPIFIQPQESIKTVQAGDVVTVTFDCRDPEGDVQWRLFYLKSDDSRTAPANQLGTQLVVGTENVGTFSFQTRGLAPGDYTLGLSATDSGTSITATVAAGQDDRIVTIPNAARTTPVVRVTNPNGTNVPTISFKQPAADVTLYKDDPFKIEFAGAILTPGGTGTIEVFYDTDAKASNGFTLIAELPVVATSIAFPKGVAEGTYYIGATIRDGINNPVTVYAAGRIKVVRDVTLTVTEPNTSLSVSPGAKVNIKWTTNAPDKSGTVDVFAQTVDASGLPVGEVITVLTGAAITVVTATFSSATPGLYRLTVLLNLKDGVPVQQSAPHDVRVSSLPPIIWLGSIAEESPRVDGAIFGGVNFEDNAGTSFSAAGDLNDDGSGEFLIGARYGKPFFTNPTGIGPGEAYLIYGQAGTKKLHGEYNLNSVGTTALRGVTFTGVRTVGNSSETEGLSDLGLIPDTDDDGKGELVFGFPKTNSASHGALERAGQFLNGGLVILSSTNSIIADPSTGVPVVNLDLVGMRFSDETVVPSDPNLAVSDLQTFQAGNPSSNPPTFDACVPGTDGVPDTIVGPSVGFHFALAPARWEQLGFTPIDVGTAPAATVCATQFAVTACRDGDSSLFSGFNAGSGFYPASTRAIEPIGARLIGWHHEDRMGTSIAVALLADQPGAPGQLLISAPSQTASQASFPNYLTSDILDSGMVQIVNNRHLWGVETFWHEGLGLPPPTPHQYLPGSVSHCGDGRAPTLGGTPIFGAAGDKIQNVLGIGDFNLDGLNDIVVGAPTAGGGQGRVYIAFRREPGLDGLEGAFLLNKLGLAPDDPDRLDGLLITTGTFDSLGTSLASGFDFNGDGIPDLVIGSPDAGGGIGEVIILFGGTGIVSPAGGLTVQALLAQTRTATGGPVAARIRGNALDAGGHFGFNIANAGDINGDGLDDLLIAAPGASPRFDGDPNDGKDQLDTLGVEDPNAPGTGKRYEGVKGDPQLLQAGLVYVIYGSNRLDKIRTCQDSDTLCNTPADCPTGKTCDKANFTVNISDLGKPQLRGLIIAGRHAGDRIGGGDAGDATAGGIAAKRDRGRSNGLAGAGDVDGDGRADILIGSILADPRRDPTTEIGVQNGGEAYLIYGSNIP